MTERLFLYIDILGFKNLVKSTFDINELYRRVDRLNVHSDNDFTSIVFSDTILVYGNQGWLKHPKQGLMWLIEFAQDLFYNLVSIDIHFRAYITKGDFEHHQLKNIEAYYGEALIDCYERERRIKCAGVFLDPKLVQHSDIFHVTKYSDEAYFVHVMQHLDEISSGYEDYPMEGWMLEATGMEWWTAYLLRYLETIHGHAHNDELSTDIRLKFENAWEMIASRHEGLCRRLVEENFEFGRVIQLNWTEKLARIGTTEGAFE